MQNDTDDKSILLWKGIVASDATAFNELMKLFYAQLYKYGSTLTDNLEIVKDSIQNVFLAIWKNKSSLKPISYVQFYLLKSVRREIYRQIQTATRKSDNDQIYLRSVNDVQHNWEDNLIMEERRRDASEKVKKIMSSLSKRQQEIIYLRYYLDMKPEEIAEIMSVNRQSVYNLLSDSLQRLKANLQNDN